MPNYVYNTFFIKGTKQSVADLLNLGLKRTKTRKRVSAQMSGEEMVSLLNGMERSLKFSSFIPRPKTYDEYDTTNPMRGFIGWYACGCTGACNYDADTYQKRMVDINEYIETRPELFPPIEQPEKEKTDFDIFADAVENQDPTTTKVYNNPEEYQLKALRMMHPELVEQYEEYVRGYKRAQAYQQLKYGAVGWYDWNCENYGCKWSMEIERWAVVKETDDCFCLSAFTETPWSPPIAFFDFLNKKEGITIYAYGIADYYWGYMWNGRTLEDAEVDPDKDSRYEQMLQEYADEKGVDLNSYEAQHGCAPDFFPEEVDGRILDEYLDRYKEEIAKEIGCEKV